MEGRTPAAPAVAAAMAGVATEAIGEVPVVAAPPPAVAAAAALAVRAVD